MSRRKLQERRSIADDDARQQAALASALDLFGNLDEAALIRQDLVFTLLDPDLRVLEDVMIGVPGNLSDAVRDEVEFKLRDSIERAVCGSDSSRSRPVDLDRLSDPGSSPVSWAISVARRKLRWALADAQRDVQYVELDDTLPEVQTPGPVIPDYSNPDVAATEALLDTHVRGRGPDLRLIGGAKVAHELFQIPPLHVPAARSERDELLRLIESDPSLLAESLREAVEAEASDREHPASVLWALFRAEDAAALLERDRSIVGLVARTALLPRPKPRVVDIRRLRSVLRGASDKPTWPAIADNLVTSWLAEHYEGERVGASSWADAVDLALNFPGHPLGSPRFLDAAGVDHLLRAALRAERDDTP